MKTSITAMRSLRQPPRWRLVKPSQAHLVEYYPRTGVSGVSRGQGRMNYDETTIADLFKAGGYATGCFGKWHNGTQPPYHPNSSFFTHWTRADDFITWDIEVGTSGQYEVIVYYTCAAGDEGVTIRLAMEGGNSVPAKVVEVFDPPLYDKSKVCVAESHYFVKDFKPLSLGTPRLEKGRGTLKLDAVDMPGKRVIDVLALDLLLIRYN